ncbi:hypothetical protein K443DRAFT_87811 [Laccaria amethystina LaAM-08-1]|uniref:Uncharacterized protein n=1 Tax=Laccaria amethystina LaAM-08-1 TaxID=1095629 RepID=A0A0C9XZI7_9AGAR|nr:hypothetical protein K443DRAFT_87811 [Laccaria amethystina LaAM-08-1]
MSVQVKEVVIPTDPTAPLLDENNKPIQHPVIGMGRINGLFIKKGLKYTDVRIVIDSKETRNGYGTEVLTEVMTMAFGEYGAEIVQLEIMVVNGPFDSFRKNFGEFKRVKRDGRYGREKVWEIWRAEVGVKITLRVKKASK